MPKFEDKKDDIDAFIRRFETIAKSENIADNMMSQHLLTLVGGRGLDACHTLTDEEIKDYKTLKKTLLEFYHLTEETYRQKFHQLQPNKNEDFKVFTNDLKLTLEKWIEAASINKTYEDLFQFVLVDKILNSVHSDLYSFLQERKPRDIKTVTEMTQKFIAAHPTNPVCKKYDETELTSVFMTHVADRSKYHMQFKPDRQQQMHQSDKRCFYCNGLGHYKKDCRKARRPNSFQHNNQFRAHSANGRYYNINSNRIEHVHFMRTIGHHKLPSFQCRVNGQVVNAIRDTGCSTLAVKSSVVHPNQYTGKHIPVQGFDGKISLHPTVRIDVHTPYISGRYAAVVFNKGPYDLIIGNVIDNQTLPQGDIDKWLQTEIVQLVETRAQTAAKVIEESKASEQAVNNETKQSVVTETTWSPESFQQEQHNDKSLSKIFKLAQKKSVTVSKNKKEHSFFVRDNTLFRKFTDNDKTVNQLVAPQKYRQAILHHAHDLPLTAHMGRTKTKQRIESAFYWPGMDKDISAYVKSCHICRTQDTSKPPAAPLLRHIATAPPICTMESVDLSSENVTTDELACKKIKLDASGESNNIQKPCKEEDAEIPATVVDNEKCIENKNGIHLESEIHEKEVPINEIQAGITEYLGEHEGFSAVIKQRYSDFIVNEVDLDGNEVHLTQMTCPVEETDEDKKAEDNNDKIVLEKPDVISDEDLSKIDNLVKTGLSFHSCSHPGKTEPTG
ncbi:uncharacterized protein LOC131941415 [Physella acuta]|uniref:uncharacterized protein LOC131941415 n=1 Tax=Physella acuta TaxID=109671 RepID=UPI0027DD3736|nr:uncharacterized protein LOC131941415 [Physella acuta]